MDLDPSLLPHWYYHLFDSTPFGWPLSTACNIVPWSAYTKLCQFIFIAFIEQCSIYDNLNTGPWEFLREFIENFRWGSSNQLISNMHITSAALTTQVSGKRNPARIWEITSFWIVFPNKCHKIWQCFVSHDQTKLHSRFLNVLSCHQSSGDFLSTNNRQILVFLTSKLCL